MCILVLLLGFFYSSFEAIVFLESQFIFLLSHEVDYIEFHGPKYTTKIFATKGIKIQEFFWMKITNVNYWLSKIE